jgi:hypothetical protein
MAPIRTYMVVFYDAQHRDSIINNLMDYVPTCSCMDTDIFDSSYIYTEKPLNLASQRGQPGQNTNGSNMRSSQAQMTMISDPQLLISCDPLVTSPKRQFPHSKNKASLFPGSESFQLHIFEYYTIITRRSGHTVA